REDIVMWPVVFLCAAFAPGQAPATPDSLEVSAPLLPPTAASPPPPPPPPPSVPTPERYALMKMLQGSYPGWLLDGEHMQITGWTDMAFTASSTTHDQLPMGFNFKANQFLLQQNYLRWEKAVNTSGPNPDVGFRFDTILPGTDYRFTMARG